jgi:DNA-binding NtrC family response regulator
MSGILIIDDSREFTDLISQELTRQGYDVQSAHSGYAGLKLAAENPPRLILLDLRLADMSGLEVLNRVKASMPDVDVAIVTGHPELSSALAAIKGKVLDYLCKPFPFRELEAVLHRVFQDHRPAQPGRPPGDPEGLCVEMVGVSRATQELQALVSQLASSGVRAALITGESGTGKDLAARLFHAASPRRNGPFVEVNCSAVSEGLFESEFFGHERGAFTGAVGARRGLAELADGGTLFLDEVAEIPLSCQPKLLRFLEDQGFLRVGGGRKIRVDVQIVAATNRDLRAMVEQWAFRQDLYFRLNVVPIVIPPLRDRREDILPLAAYWLQEANTRYGKCVAGFTAGAEALLQAYDWPGNVRELRNLVERLVLLCPAALVDHTQFPPEYTVAPALALAGASAAATNGAGGQTLEALELAHIHAVLARVAGNKTKAAEILGISRQTLRTKIASGRKTAAHS